MKLGPRQKIMDVHFSYNIGDCFQYEGNFYNIVSILGSGNGFKRAVVEGVM